MRKSFIKIFAVTAAVAAVLTIAAGCQANNETSEKSSVTTTEESAQTKDLKMTETELYNFLEEYQHTPTVKMITNFTLKDGTDITDDNSTTVYYHPGGNIETYTNEAGDRCAIMTDVDMEEVYAINITKQEYFVLSQGKIPEGTRCSFSPSFCIEDYEGAHCYEGDNHSIVVDKTTDSGIDRTVYTTAGIDGLNVDKYTLASEDAEPVHTTSINYRLTKADPGELEQFAIGIMKENKFSDDKKEHSIEDFDKYYAAS